MAAHINRHVAGASSTATPDGPAVAPPVASHGGTGSTAAKRLLSEDDPCWPWWMCLCDGSHWCDSVTASALDVV